MIDTGKFVCFCNCIE